MEISDKDITTSSSSCTCNSSPSSASSSTRRGEERSDSSSHEEDQRPQKPSRVVYQNMESSTGTAPPPIIGNKKGGVSSTFTEIPHNVADWYGQTSETAYHVQHHGHGDDDSSDTSSVDNSLLEYALTLSTLSKNGNNNNNLPVQRSFKEHNSTISYSSRRHQHNMLTDDLTTSPKVNSPSTALFSEEYHGETAGFPHHRFSTLQYDNNRYSSRRASETSKFEAGVIKNRDGGVEYSRGNTDDHTNMMLINNNSDSHLLAYNDIKCQLKSLTRSMENCQSDMSEVRADVESLKNDFGSVQFVKDEVNGIRETISRLESRNAGRHSRLQNSDVTISLMICLVTALLGMVQFGYNTGVTNAPETIIERFVRSVYRKTNNGENMTYKASNFLYSIIVSIFALGGMVGGYTGIYYANSFGRKSMLMVNSVIGLIGAACMFLSKFAISYHLLILGRFITGINCGINTSIVPLYISEIAPYSLRPNLGAMNQIGVTIGLLLSQVMGISSIFGTDERWHILLAISALLPSIQLILLPFCLESPRHLLLTANNADQARKALLELRNSKDIEEDILEIRADEISSKLHQKFSIFQVLTCKELRFQILIAIIMQLSQQLSGINAIFYYSTNLFMTTGLNEGNARFATIVIGTITLLTTIASLVVLHSKSSRRNLHLYGLGGMFIFSIFITISFLVKELVSWIWWLSVISALFYVVFFAVGPGFTSWIITAQLFKQGARPAAMSIAVVINWMANFLVGIGFPTMQTNLEKYTFLPFSVFLGLFWVFTYKYVPHASFAQNSSSFQATTMRNMIYGNESQFNSATYPSNNLNGPPKNHQLSLTDSGGRGSKQFNQLINTDEAILRHHHLTNADESTNNCGESISTSVTTSNHNSNVNSTQILLDDLTNENDEDKNANKRFSFPSPHPPPQTHQQLTNHFDMSTAIANNALTSSHVVGGRGMGDHQHYPLTANNLEFFMTKTASCGAGVEPTPTILSSRNIPQSIHNILEHSSSASSMMNKNGHIQTVECEDGYSDLSVNFSAEPMVDIISTTTNPTTPPNIGANKHSFLMEKNNNNKNKIIHRHIHHSNNVTMPPNVAHE